MPLIGEVRGLGLMVGVELVTDEKRTPATAEAEAVRDNCLAAGVLVGVGGVYGNVVRVQPPLVSPSSSSIGRSKPSQAQSSSHSDACCNRESIDRI